MPLHYAERKYDVLRAIAERKKVLDNTPLGPGITNGEEEEMKLTHVVPFLVEDELPRLGAIFEKKADWQAFSITDGRLITRTESRIIDWHSPSALEAGRAKGSRLGFNCDSALGLTTIFGHGPKVLPRVKLLRRTDEGSTSSTLRSTQRDRKR